MAIKWSFNNLRNLITHNTSPKSASYLANDEFKYFSNIELKIWGYKDTLGISKIKFTDFLDKFDDSEKITNAHENKSFFSSFSSPLKTVYNFGVKSFNIIKNTSSILSSKVAETFNLVSNKALSYFGIKAEETFSFLDQIENLSDDQLLEEILNTLEEELDAIFEKMTYEKLVELINNATSEKAQELVNYIMPWHLEKVIAISPDTLIEQELKKLSDENISDKQLENIIILSEGEKLVEKLDIIPNKNLERIVSSIPNDKLAVIANNASNKNLERIVDNISDKNLPMILHLLPAEKVKQIMILIHGEEVVKQLENQQLLEEIINTPDSKLDKIKPTKLDKLISDISDENLERIIDGISNNKLATMINNASDENLERIVDSISDQNLSKVLSEISSLLPEEKFKQIMILIHGEEVVEQLENQQLLEEIINTPDNELDQIKITHEKLAELINNTSDEDLEKIIDSHSLSGSLIQQIITLIYNKKRVKQEPSNSDVDSGIDSDLEDEIEVSSNQAEQYNSDFDTKLSGALSYNDFRVFDCEDDVVYV
ncbi:MAG: hypothetical protein RLZZ81_43 [Pseudomonadota bacterium]|jgi:hypothetical protein